MAAALDNKSLVHHQYLICVDHGGEAVGDHHGYVVGYPDCELSQGLFA